VGVDDRPTVELMHQHARWTTDLLATMGLAIDLSLPPDGGGDGGEGVVGEGATQVAPSSPSSPAASLTITLRVRLSPETYLRFAEIVMRAA
jgi:hypothetical protein